MGGLILALGEFLTTPIFFKSVVIVIFDKETQNMLIIITIYIGINLYEKGTSGIFCFSFIFF